MNKNFQIDVCPSFEERRKSLGLSEKEFKKLEERLGTVCLDGDKLYTWDEKNGCLGGYYPQNLEEIYNDDYLAPGETFAPFVGVESKAEKIGKIVKILIFGLIIAGAVKGCVGNYMKKTTIDLNECKENIEKNSEQEKICELNDIFNNIKCYG